MGFHVGVVDYNPEGIGVPFADIFFNVSTIDADAVLRTAQEFKPRGIMTMATDMPMRAIARATTALGLPGISPETALKATDKGEMIKAFKSHGVEAPWFFIVISKDDLNNVKPNITFPCIMKPTDNAGSRGVMLVTSPADVDSAYAYSRQHSRSGAVIIEEYLNGREVSVEIMVVQGMVHILAVTDKLTTGAPHFVEMGHCQPSQLPDQDLKKIKDLAKRAVRAVGIESGPAHVEIMLTREGPKMIELGARMGGDCITSHLVPLSTGIDMVKATIEVATGQLPDLAPKFNRGSAIRYCDIRQGTIVGITGVAEAKKISGIQEIVFTKKAGDRIGAIKSSTDRAGYVIAQADQAADAIASCNEALACIRVITDSEA
ncbi:MAG: ATP-grasp domain-containing protein [Deltaproteobacteria bacterium]|nr:ATP-grasp domain-containing protein [Deltaproteobacteria bacterium]